MKTSIFWTEAEARALDALMRERGEDFARWARAVLLREHEAAGKLRRRR